MQPSYADAGRASCQRSGGYRELTRSAPPGILDSRSADEAAVSPRPVHLRFISDRHALGEGASLDKMALRLPTSVHDALSSRARLPLLAVGLLLVLFTLTRLTLFGLADRAGLPPLGTLAAVLAVGVLFDLLAALWLIAPLLLYMTLLPERWYRHRWHRTLLVAGFAAELAGAFFFAAAEGFFFAELDSRFNFVAIDYLLYPTEVVTNIRESYPIGLVLSLVAAAAIAGALLLRPSLRRAFARPASWAERGATLAAFGLVLAALTAFVSPQFARVSDDRQLNEIASNGAYSFWLALLGTDAPYAGLYPTAEADLVFARLHRLLATPAAPTSSFAASSTLG